MEQLPYADKLKAILERPGLIDEACDFVSGGGSLIDLAQSWDIRYNDLAKWLNADKERAMKMAVAVDAGNEWLRNALLREAELIARFDIRKVYNEDGSIKQPKDWPEEIARAIAAVEVDELFEGAGKERQQVGWTKKVKFWSKDRMIETLGKQVGLFNPVQKHHVSTSLEDLVAGSKESAA